MFAHSLGRKDPLTSRLPARINSPFGNARGLFIVNPTPQRRFILTSHSTYAYGIVAHEEGRTYLCPPDHPHLSTQIHAVKWQKKGAELRLDRIRGDNGRARPGRTAARGLLPCRPSHLSFKRPPHLIIVISGVSTADKTDETFCARERAGGVA